MEASMNCRRLIIIFFIIIALIFPRAVFANQATLPSDIKDSEIGGVIEDYINKNKETTAAVSIAIFRGQDTIYKTAYGYSNIEEGIKADDETVYEWGSVSKLLVWVSVMQLWEDGKIDLDTDINEYLPDDFFTKLEYDEAITMVNLMNHNAGFEETLFQTCPADENGLLPLKEALRVTEPHQINKPGHAVAYSNWTTALAGYIVELISGQPYYEYVQEHIFKPLDMNHTAQDPTYSDNLWVKSKLLEGEGYTIELEAMEDGLYYMNLYPAGSTAGTLEDLEKFAKALVANSNASNKLFKNEETLLEMLSYTLKFPGTEVDYINHGFWSHEYKVQALGHGGNTNMYSSYLLFDPISGVGIVIMTNQAGESTYNYKLPPLIFGNVGEMATEDGSSDVSEMEGLYYSPRTIRNGIAKMYTVISIIPYLDDGNDNLAISLFGMADINAKQIAPDTFIHTQKAGSTELVTVARYSNIDGMKKISTPYGEAVEADGDVWASGIVTILLVIAMLWSAAVLLVSLIRFIITKIKRKRFYDSFKKYEIIICLSTLLLFINIISVTNKMVGCEVPKSDLIANIIASIVLAVIPIVYAIRLYRKWSKLISSKPQKISYIISLFMGFVISLTVIVLEMYKW